jgi:hypothetical protein
LLGELLTRRLVMASSAILGGIGLVMVPGPRDRGGVRRARVVRDGYFFIMSAHMESIFIIASSFFIIPSLFAIAMWSLQSCIVISFFIMPSLAMPSSFFIMLLLAQPLMVTAATQTDSKVFNAVFIEVSPGLV